MKQDVLKENIFRTCTWKPVSPGRKYRPCRCQAPHSTRLILLRNCSKVSPPSDDQPPSTPQKISANRYKILVQDTKKRFRRSLWMDILNLLPCGSTEGMQSRLPWPICMCKIGSHWCAHHDSWNPLASHDMWSVSQRTPNSITTVDLNRF